MLLKACIVLLMKLQSYYYLGKKAYELLYIPKFKMQVYVNKI